ncbi:uncharacterized protein LOC124882404 [Girardinichthys multiradiatus]|uniref:uncharacterized protein LOC124882404 n=1 Tax=Girardinichthys multiradiatus TaxID=208333 RepID=UPI001FAC8280|nr:uncharacterized protein LOC124882404 [Girardinichthys multiradiatus]
MISSRKIQTSLILTLMLYLAAAAGEPLYFTVRDGDEVTLPCGNMIDIRNYYKSITWIFSYENRTVTLFEHGQIHRDAAVKSDRLRVAADCSLVIKKVSVEDAGLYVCRQFINGQQQGTGSNSYLSVVHTVEQKQKDKIILNCSVMEYNWCKHTVEWLYEGTDKTFSDMEKSEQSCSVTVTFPASFPNWRPNLSENLKCKVTNIYTNKVQLIAFRHQSSGGRTDSTDESATIKTINTSKPTTAKTTSTPETEPSNKWTSRSIKTSININNSSKTQGWSWLYIIGPAAIIITVLVIIGWKKTKGEDIIP